MKIKLMDEELFISRAREENSCMISALGLQNLGAVVVGKRPSTEEAQPAPARLAFGTLISFRRRALKMSLEDLAEKARVDLEEILSIEENSRDVAEPRTVYQLSHALKLPTAQLLVLSGNATTPDKRLNTAALKFAARSRAVEKLNRDQTEALNEFVKVLVDQATEKRK